MPGLVDNESMAYQPPPNGFRTFLIVWGTQSISVLGSALTYFAVTIWLTQTLYPRAEQKPELAFALSAVSLAFALPTVFGAPLAGAWADRHDRKRTMMATDALNGCVSLALATMIATQTLQEWMLVGLAFLQALVGAFHAAAFDTSYAMLVPEEQLPRANGMMQTIWSLSGSIAPAIAATLIALPALARQGAVPGAAGSYLAQFTDGSPVAITLDAVSFFIASLALVFLYIPSPRRADMQAGKNRPTLAADVREGALYIWNRRTLLWLLGTFTVANFVASPLGILQPLVVKFNLAEDWLARGFSFETAFALLGSITAIGGVVGGTLISTWGGLKKKRVYGVVVAMMVQGAAMTAFGLSSWLYLSAALGFLISSTVPVMNAHSQAIWQTQTPRELQGRVFSVRRLIAQCTWPLSTLLAGLIGGLFNPGAVIAILGAVYFIFCLGQLYNPYLLRVEDKEWLDAMAARAASLH